MAKFQLVRGFPCPDVSWFLPKNIEDTMDYVPHDNDIIITSYPKTGTTWLQYIVFQIISKGEKFPGFDETLHKYAPFMEMVGTAAIDKMDAPRIYKHHFPYDRVQKNEKAKILYIFRRPDDVCISFYHFTNSLRMENPDLNGFVESFISGEIGYGHYCKNVLSFLEHKDDENLLIISYETLKNNTKEEILRIAKFLGQEYYQALSEDSELLEKVLEHTSFEYMKNNLSLTHPEDADKGDSSTNSASKVNFFRKGVVGDGKKSLTQDQLHRLQNVAKEILKDYPCVLKEWFKD